MWLRRFIQGWNQQEGQGDPPLEPQAKPAGFGEVSRAFEPAFEPAPGPAPGPDAPFLSLGPEGHRKRMREKAIERGPEAFEDYELLEMLLFMVFKRGDTKPLAKQLINRFGSFARLLGAPRHVLLETPGLGPHSVNAIIVVQEAAVRLSRAEVSERQILNNMERLETYLQTTLGREKVEKFNVLFLDPRNRLIADETLGHGTVNHTPVYPREIFKRALDLHCTALILVHNHPSGDPTPSRADIEMTAEVVSAAAALSIVVHDHIIVGNGVCSSFRQMGLIR